MADGGVLTGAVGVFHAHEELGKSRRNRGLGSSRAFLELKWLADVEDSQVFAGAWPRRRQVGSSNTRHSWVCFVGGV